METSDVYELLLVSGSAQGRRYPLVCGENTIGRHSANAVSLNEEGLVVSKKHAVLVVNAGEAELKDCNSTNGLFVNETRVSRAVVTHGDLIGLGEKGPRLRFVLRDAGSLPSPTGEATAVGTHIPDSISKIDPSCNIDTPVERTNADSCMDDSASPVAGKKRWSEEDDSFSDISLPLVSERDRQKKKPDNQGKRLLSTREVEGYLARPAEFQSGKGGIPLTTTQEVLMSKVRKIYKKRNRLMFTVTGSIIALLCAVAVYYALQYYRLEKTYSKGVALREEVQEADSEYEHIRQMGNFDQLEKERLLAQVSLREKRLDSIMALLPRRYQQRFFSDPVEKYLYDIVTSFNEPFYRVPSHMIGKVKYYVDRFKNEYQRRRDILPRWRNDYYPYIKKVFREHHVPVALAYIAMQESMLDTGAISSAGARGFWQFIPSTGKQYGLVIISRRDDRTDWKKSTVAAAKYLHDLLAEFGKGRAVFLAIAAYNTGGGNVRKALRKIRDPLRDRDFWYLYRTSSSLADETREYVPQVLARMILDMHSSELGL